MCIRLFPSFMTLHCIINKQHQSLCSYTIHTLHTFNIPVVGWILIIISYVWVQFLLAPPSPECMSEWQSSHQQDTERFVTVTWQNVATSYSGCTHGQRTVLQVEIVHELRSWSVSEFRNLLWLLRITFLRSEFDLLC